MTEFKCLGLPLDTSWGENPADYDIIQPLEALVIVRGLDSEDNEAHWVMRTAHLRNIEMRGMLDWAMDEVRNEE